jgi:hypothetical protein
LGHLKICQLSGVRSRDGDIQHVARVAVGLAKPDERPLGGLPTGLGDSIPAMLEIINQGTIINSGQFCDVAGDDSRGGGPAGFCGGCVPGREEDPLARQTTDSAVV